MGESSAQGSLVIAILLMALAVHNLFQGIDRGGIFDYIAAAIQIGFAGYFFLKWYRYWRGFHTMVFDSETYQIRENGIVTEAGSFCNLRVIDQDGRGYTITLESGNPYRLLRKDLDSELVAALDSVRQRPD